MPDALLNGLGYLLGTVADVQLPVELMSVVERGPDVLNFVTHPHAPALIRIGDVDLLALRRSFGSLSVYITIANGKSWVVAMCPMDEAPELIRIGI